MSDKNKDFLPPEMIETMRASVNITVQQLFRNKFTKTGNLTVSPSQPKVVVTKCKSEKEEANVKTKVCSKPLIRFIIDITKIDSKNSY